jgi:hypothetical protein
MYGLPPGAGPEYVQGQMFDAAGITY